MFDFVKDLWVQQMEGLESGHVFNGVRMVEYNG